MFMKDAVAQPPTPNPDPHRANPTAPARLNRVLSVIRKLIDYGKQLAATVQQRAAAPRFALFANSFGATDLAAILARITAGLRRAAALEARLCERAERGRDLTSSPLRLPAVRAPCLPGQVAPPAPQPEPPGPAEDSRLARLPTEEEIANQVRRRPVGAVIVDICLDLGIRPGDCNRAFWDELCHAIIAYGGSLSSYFNAVNTRPSACDSGDLPDHPDSAWPAAPPHLPALATGPP